MSSKSLFTRLFGMKAVVTTRTQKARLGVEVLEPRDVPATITVTTDLDELPPDADPDAKTLRMAVAEAMSNAAPRTPSSSVHRW